MENCELLSLIEGLSLSGDIVKDAPAFLLHWGKPRTVDHTAQVAVEALRIASLHGVDADKAEVAAWLHDISAVIPSPKRAEAARDLGVPLLPEEQAFPMIVHQKLSEVVARELFRIQDQEILSAIGCHTTLRAGASALDKTVFIADKVAWDQAGIPPYRDELLAALASSLDGAALVYLRYLWERRATLPVVHPWMVGALIELSGGQLP
jgi:predicted HD superfamily hydrolase involved in NAD metabolism